jgi:ArsR family metal-binding transcriptional regulator
MWTESVSDGIASTANARVLQLKDGNLRAMIAYLQKEFPEEKRAAKNLIIESKGYEDISSIQQILQSGAWLYPRKSNQSCCKNIMEASQLLNVTEVNTSGYHPHKDGKEAKKNSGKK